MEILHDQSAKLEQLNYHEEECKRLNREIFKTSFMLEELNKAIVALKGPEQNDKF